MEGKINFFFFKQKTAYEMLRSLVGSEMCIRDREEMVEMLEASRQYQNNIEVISTLRALMIRTINFCLLYTSDAADE